MGWRVELVGRATLFFLYKWSKRARPAALGVADPSEWKSFAHAHSLKPIMNKTLTGAALLLVTAAVAAIASLLLLISHIHTKLTHSHTLTHPHTYPHIYPHTQSHPPTHARDSVGAVAWTPEAATGADKFSLDRGTSQELERTAGPALLLTASTTASTTACTRTAPSPDILSLGLKAQGVSDGGLNSADLEKALEQTAPAFRVGPAIAAGTDDRGKERVGELGESGELGEVGELRELGSFRSLLSVDIFMPILKELIIFAYGQTFAACFNAAITGAFKGFFGRMRPDFLNRCFPSKFERLKIPPLDFTSIDRAFPECETPAIYDLVDGRRSFPSGHSSSFAAVTATGAFFLYRVVKIRTRAARDGRQRSELLERGGGGEGGRKKSREGLGWTETRSKSVWSIHGLIGKVEKLAGEPILLALLFVLLAVVIPIFVGSTRIVDRRHHPTDVLAGLILGWFTAALTNALYFRLEEPEGGEEKREGRSSRGEQGGARAKTFLLETNAGVRWRPTPSTLEKNGSFSETLPLSERPLS